jgi:hypothetical protein
MTRSILLIAVAALTAATAPQATRLETTAGNYYLTYQTDPAPIPLNQLFRIDVTAYFADGRPLDETVNLHVDGRMPQHRHGMNRKPTVTNLGPGRYRIEGMLFHMPGRWELYFDFERAGMVERAQTAVLLE